MTATPFQRIDYAQGTFTLEDEYALTVGSIVEDCAGEQFEKQPSGSNTWNGCVWKSCTTGRGGWLSKAIVVAVVFKPYASWADFLEERLSVLKLHTSVDYDEFFLLMGHRGQRNQYDYDALTPAMRELERRGLIAQTRPGSIFTRWAVVRPTAS